MSKLPLDSADSRDRLAEAAQQFDSQLRLGQDIELTSTLEHSRIASVLKLLHATLRPGSTRSLSSSDDSESAFTIPQRVGRFIVAEFVGEGGFGVVYKAFDEVLRRDVALKAVPRRPGLQSASEDYRLREARAAARVNHPYLVPLYEVLDDEQCVYLVSEFCNGPTLSQYLLDQGGALYPSWAADVTIKLGQAIAHAHGRGLVHRDIKPSNVLLSHERADGDILPFTPRLTDFGLVLEIDSELGIQGHGRLTGTIIYMAPEQIMGDDRWDARSGDVYALGLLLYQMLAGKLPYRSSKPLELLTEICTEPIRPIDPAKPAIPNDLKAICYKALQKQPSERYQSAQLLVDDLLRWRDGREVSARPRSSLERSWRSVCRAPLLSGLFVAFVMLAIATVLTSVWSNQQLREQRGALQRALEAASLSEQAAIGIAYRSDLYQGYLAVARNDSATALSMISEIEDYGGDDQRERFDLRLLKSLINDGWSELASFDVAIEEIVPFPQSNLFAVAAGSNRIRVHHGDDGSLVREIELAPHTVIHALAISPDGKTLAVGKSSARQRWWFGESDTVEFISLDNLSTHGELRGFNATVDSLGFSGDGKRLAIGTRYEPLQIIELGSDAAPTFVDSTRRNEDLCFARGNELVLMPATNEIVVRNVIRGEDVHRIKIEDNRFFRRISSSVDGRWVAAALQQESDGFLFDFGTVTHGLDTPSEKVVEQMVLENSRGELRSIRVSPDGQFVVAGTVGGGVVVWSLDQLESTPHPSTVDENRQNATDSRRRISPRKHHVIHRAAVSAIAINESGTIVSGGEDGSVAIWSVHERESVIQECAIDGQSDVADMTSDGKIAIVGCFDGSLWRVDIASMAKVQIRPGAGTRLSSVAITPDGQWVAAVWADGRAAIGRVHSPQNWIELPAAEHLVTQLNKASLIEFTDSGTRMVLCRGSTYLEWFDLVFPTQAGNPIRATTLASYHAPTSIEAISVLDIETALTLGDVIRVSTPSVDQIPESKPGIREVRCQCIDVGRQVIYVGCLDGRIRLLDTAGKMINSSQRWIPTESAPQAARGITAITLSPDRHSILTGSDAGDVGIWDAETLRYLGPIRQGNFEGEIEKLAISRDGGVLMMHQRQFNSPTPKTNGRLRFIQLREKSLDSHFVTDAVITSITSHNGFEAGNQP